MSASLPHDALARAVRAAFGPNVVVCGTEALAGDASTRRYVRLRLEGAGRPTAVAMLHDLGRVAPVSEELGGVEAAEELPFVNVGRYLAARGLPVPELYHAALSDGLLLVEDIGDTTLWQAAVAAPAHAPALFGAAVSLLVAFQTAGAREPDSACYAFQRRFDGGLALSELEHFIDHGIETRHGRTLPAAERAALLEALGPLVVPFETGSPVLAHRDFMAWNLHVQREDGRAILRLIDFQDALLAPDVYDLAALLTDRTTRTIVTPSVEATLLARFREERQAAGLPVESDLLDRYRRCALHRALKVIGRFYFLERVKGKPGYLAYLPGVYGVAREMFDALPALAPARRLIVPLVPEIAPP